MERNKQIIIDIIKVLEIQEDSSRFAFNIEKLDKKGPEYRYNFDLALDAGFIREVRRTDTHITVELTWKGHRFKDLHTKFAVESDDPIHATLLLLFRELI